METYGKEPEQLANAAKLFELVLGKYPLEKIQEAFVAHLSRSPKMPTPSDIVALLKRDGKPPLEKSVYVALAQKKERTAFKDFMGTHDCLSVEETEYMREYEAEMLNG